MADYGIDYNSVDVSRGRASVSCARVSTVWRGGAPAVSIPAPPPTTQPECTPRDRGRATAKLNRWGCAECKGVGKEYIEPTEADYMYILCLLICEYTYPNISTKIWVMLISECANRKPWNQPYC